jgi:hypothetical protein
MFCRCHVVANEKEKDAGASLIIFDVVACCHAHSGDFTYLNDCFWRIADAERWPFQLPWMSGIGESGRWPGSDVRLLP